MTAIRPGKVAGQRRRVDTKRSRAHGRGSWLRTQGERNRRPANQASLFSLMLKPIWLVAPLPPWLVCSEYSVLILAAWNA